ncbi:hypothetical protein RhiirC2_803032, partial [Rhizophagus irregularis]
MTVAFRGKGLTWHPPNEAHTLCHVCGHLGCSPSDSRQSRDKSTSRSRSRSTSRSRNNSSSSRTNNNNNNLNTSHPNVPNRNNQTSNNNNNNNSFRNNANSSGPNQSPRTLHPNNTTSTSPSNNPTYTLPQNIIDELKAQIEKIANTLSTLDETVSWMHDTITAHEYRLSELESMINYDTPRDSDLYPP